MSKITFSLGAALFVVVTGLFVANIREVVACPAANSAQFNEDSGETSDVGENFAYSISLGWSFTATPTIGEVTYESGNSLNVSEGNVQYDPAYFFPSSCEGSVPIDISGRLDAGTQSGILGTHG